MLGDLARGVQRAVSPDASSKGLFLADLNEDAKRPEVVELRLKRNTPSTIASPAASAIEARNAASTASS